MSQVANSVTMAQRLLADRLANARCAVDATVGNGKDALFLARNTPAATEIWAFDIQQAALDATAGLLAEHDLASRVRLVLDCHSHVARYVPGPIDIAMFNLGYLPGGSHAVTTVAATTVAAVGEVLRLMGADGLLTIVTYPGHAAGLIEDGAVREVLTALPQQSFAVGGWSLLNQRNQPPRLYIVEKVGCRT
jgi:hypothetical protein